MGFGSAVRSCFGKYASWQGRAPRSEFWWFQLFVVVVSFVLSALDAALGLVVDLGSETVETTSGPITFFNGDLGALSTIWAIVIFLPSLAVLVRRLHDTDRTGWWYLSAGGVASEQREYPRIIARGQLPTDLAGTVAAHGWVVLKLTFKNDTIRAHVGDVCVLEGLEDRLSPYGMVALGSGWHLAEYANFSIALAEL